MLLEVAEGVAVLGDDLRGGHDSARLESVIVRAKADLLGEKLEVKGQVRRVLVDAQRVVRRP